MKEHLLQSLEKGIRYDGRKLDEFRKLTIKTGVSKSAEGSAEVWLGKTHIIVGVKTAIEKPYPDTGAQGNLMFMAELTPMSNERFEAGPPGMEAIEVSRLVDRSLRESKAIDLSSLCLVENEKVWNITTDVVTINADGNLITAASIGALVALKNAFLPEYDEQYVIDYNKKSKNKIPLSREPLSITVFKIGKFLLVDPIPIEEELADARLTVGVSENDTIIALQKGEDTPLTLEEIDSMCDLAIKSAQKIRKQL